MQQIKIKILNKETLLAAAIQSLIAESKIPSTKNTVTRGKKKELHFGAALLYYSSFSLII